MAWGARQRDVAAGAVVVGAAFVVVLWVLARIPLGMDSIPSLDIYAYSWPIFLYTQAALEQGHGLLWNDLQSCGQPFLGIVSTTLLYPPTWIFLPFEADVWLRGQAILHLAVAGLGSYALARELDLGRAAALGAALAFELGGVGVGIATWSPLVQGAYAWIPMALACAERVLRAPRPEAAVALGLVLTLQLLAGFPQLSVFTYELLGLRVLFELATRRDGSRGRGLAVLALGMALPLALAAVQVLPTLELASESVRTLPLAEHEYSQPGGEHSWVDFRRVTGRRVPVSGTVAGLFGVAAALLAGASLAATRRRRAIAFYLSAGGLFLALVFDTPLRDAYRLLPIAGDLRIPYRFAWVTSFCLSVLVGLGLEASSAERRGSGAPSRTLLGSLAALAGIWLLSPRGLESWEWVVAALVLLAIAMPSPRPAAEGLRSAALVALLAASLIGSDAHSALGFLPDDTTLRESSAAFEFVRERQNASERVYAAPGLPRPVDLSMRSKTAALYGLPTIVDYENLASRRFADLYVWMTSGRRGEAALSWIRSTHRVPRERRIFDLLATRWVVTGPTGADLPLALTPRWSDGHYQVLENEQALPRAFFVPEAAVVADPEARLRTLASLDHDARQLALLESLPADGFLGRPGGRGQATIASSRSEELVVQVEASEEGFLFVSDQHYPGWVATVNGEPAPIVRANHAFRLVRVPAGPSTVAFHYRPWSVRAGAVISLATLAGLVAWGAHRRRSRVS